MERFSDWKDYLVGLASSLGIGAESYNVCGINVNWSPTENEYMKKLIDVRVELYKQNIQTLQNISLDIMWFGLAIWGVCDSKEGIKLYKLDITKAKWTKRAKES